jgi:hypothetical protein
MIAAQLTTNAGTHPHSRIVPTGLAGLTPVMIAVFLPAHAFYRGVPAPAPRPAAGD